MAVATVSDTGGNWNASASWVSNSIPAAIDNVVFTSTSGPLTLTDSRVCTGINFSNYTNTMTFNNNLTLNGPLNLGTGGYTLAGTYGVVASQSVTFTGGGQTWSLPITFVGTSLTFTFSDTFSTTGNVIFNGTTLTTLNNNRFNIGGNLTVNTTANISGSTLMVLSGTGTWSHTSTGQIRSRLNVDTPGTIYIGPNVYLSSGTFSFITGSVVTTNSTLNLVGSQVIGSTTASNNAIYWDSVFVNSATSPTITFTTDFYTSGTMSLFISNTVVPTFTVGTNNLYFRNSSGQVTGSLNLAGGTNTFVVPQTITVSNLLLGTGSQNLTVNSNTINVVGNLSSLTTLFVGGTTTFSMAGTGSVTTSQSMTGTEALRNNIVIDTPGTITFPSGRLFYNTGFFRYVSGNVSVDSNHNLFCSRGASFSTQGITWSSVFFQGVASPGNIFTIASNFQTSKELIFTASVSLPRIRLIGTGSMIIGGNFHTNGIASNQFFVFGTPSFQFVGTGTWSALASTSIMTVANNVTINTDGLLNIGTLGYRYDDASYFTSVNYGSSFDGIVASFSYIKGDVNVRNILFQDCAVNPKGTTNSIYFDSVHLFSSTTIQNDLYITGTLSLRNGTFTLPNSNFIFRNRTNELVGSLALAECAQTILPSGLYITVSNLYTYGTQDNQVLNGTVDVMRDFTHTRGTFGSFRIKIVGTGTFSGTSNQYLRTNVDINSTQTNITGQLCYAANTLTYYGGTISTTGSTLFLCSSSFTTATINSTTASTPIYWNNITMPSQGSTITLTLSSDLYCNGTFSVANVTTTGGTITITSSTAKTIKFTNSNNQIVGNLDLSSHNATVKIPSNLDVKNLTLGTSSSAINTITNDYLINIHGDLAIRGANNCTGTTNFFLVGTGSWYNVLTTNGFISNNLTINTPGTITLGANVKYGNGGVLTYTSGTIVATGSLLTVSGPTTLNTSGINWESLEFRSGTVTLNSQIYATGTSSFSTSNFTFAGASGISTANMNFATANLTHTFVSGNNYVVRNRLLATQSRASTLIGLTSSVSGSSAFLTIDPQATVDIGYLRVTDINSSLGKPVYVYKGTLLRTTNWNNLPTDIQSVSTIYIN